MLKKEISKEHKKSIEAVISYILKNLNGDVSLEKLAQIANYSPFHLQKLFKDAFGDSPKQYIIRLRLETAAHLLIIHKHKPVSEIAFDSGFSSPAVFARAFKTYFKITAEEMRLLDPGERLKLRKESFHLKEMIDSKRKGATENEIEVSVINLPAITGVCINTFLDDAGKIQHTFGDILKQTKAHDLIDTDSKIYGLIYPHQDRYSTFISIKSNVSIPKKFEEVVIQNGKYASFEAEGSMKELFKKLTIFSEQWLPKNKYKFADFFGFESFDTDPSKTNYVLLKRKVFIRIVPE